MVASAPRQRRRCFALAFAASAALFAAKKYDDRRTSNPPFLGNDGGIEEGVATFGPDNGDRRRRRRLASRHGLARFADPKSVKRKVKPRPVAPIDDARQVDAAADDGVHFTPVDHESRRKCQIVYIMGVEGATHHGFIPILQNLARHQVDPATGRRYVVDADSHALKAGLFGWYHRNKIKKWGFDLTPEVDDPDFVRAVVSDACPPGDGRRHVLIEWASFPSGHEDDQRSYRVHRAPEWPNMTPEEVANSDEALSHPLRLNAFYRAYSPHVDVKFVVLHRPFLETIASHRDWDGGPETHSNVIRGFMLVLRRFLDTHLYDQVSGGRLWRLVCVEKIMEKNYNDKEKAAAARVNVLRDLAEFLGWPDGNCPKCFNSWHESKKDPIEVLGEENVAVLRSHMEWLEGVWPPPGEESAAGRRCSI